MLGHFAIRNPEPVHLLNGETLTRWRDAPELALVRDAAHATYRHPIPIRDGVLDVEVVVGEDTPTPLCVFPGVAMLVFGNGHVLEMVLRHELLEGCEVVLIPDPSVI